MIVENELPPGSRVDEKRLCEVFEISRTPLREALKVLASEGLIDLFPNRSPRVAPITQENIEELFQVIGWLEHHAGELAAERVTGDDLARLYELHARMTELHDVGSRTEYWRLNRVLHSTIVEAARNTVLASTHASLMAQVQRARYLAIGSQEHWDRGVREHETILAALEQRDGARAGELLQTHVSETGERVAAVFRENLAER
jgi:DNA-binding GntR family transcriptional regulator